MSHLLASGLASMLDELDEAVSCGYAHKLEGRLAGFPLLLAALHAVELARSPTTALDGPALLRAGRSLDALSRDAQLQILAWMLAQADVSLQATTLVEGTLALRATKGATPGSSGDPQDDAALSPTLGDNIDGSMAAVLSAKNGAPPPINPGPWNSQGQWGGFYVGSEAHKGIAEVYKAAHLGDRVATNDTPLRRILEWFEDEGAHVDRHGMEKGDGSWKPDILNVRRKHLYEIKPAAAQSEAAFKARMYIRGFARAGIDIELGQVDEPGTAGAMSAPGGVFRFSSPEPGVITYQYNKARLVPVPVPKPATSSAAASEEEWRWELRPLKLTPAQKSAIVTTTVGAALLIVVMIILAPVGA